ncbi:F1F0 ATP synthase assembly Atp10 [Pyrenophora seminiperda CCB06]|uniref:F1F0 ATP synthase assembly Atp10 n=1 Tax=Pyrenophora seminiperda CCB06 TaxID=1302712 RepID=A0A3M7M418_9PLEO|nr:F1F0 ATP synthase assembly Atp10 [Pyrenophora seminiperda CCB06]
MSKQSLTRTFTSGRTLRRPPTDPKPTESTSKRDPKAEDVFIPKPLGRPIGFKKPPQPGENASIPKTKKDYSGMTMAQRNLEKRKDLAEEWGTHYFRDFKNIRKYRSGKTFMANPRIFKKDAALYFPNLHGDTLEAKGMDTTNVLNGKVSVVRVYSSQWGLSQAETFTGKSQNAELQQILSQNPGIAQMVDVNIEENTMKAWIIALFRWQLKASRPKEQWGRYFVVRKGVSERIRETIGLLNGRVGYIYLVDQDCKIRWAGSGDAEGTEMEDMNRGFAKMVAEAQ